MKKRFISLLAIGLSCMMILGGCGKKGPEQSENGGSGSVQMDSEQVLNTIYFEVATLDANDTTDNQSSSILNAVQEGLVRIENNGKGDEIVPAGAEKWEASEDGLTWTFHLRKMNWSDGEPVVAKHYVDSFQRILNPDNGFAYGFLAYDIEGAEEYNTGKGTMRGMEAPIVLTGIYPINWKEYSKVDDTNSGTFMYLVNRISK